MKLTKIHRQAFVKAVMADIPREDFVEQARSLLHEDSITQLPKCLQEAARDPKARDMIYKNSYYHRDFGSSFSVFGNRFASFTPTPACAKKLEAIAQLHTAQRDKLNAVEEKLTASIEACTTLKIAKERLPEFEKYLPEDKQAEKSAYLPAVANLVADLSVLGWPKGKQAVAA